MRMLLWVMIVLAGVLCGAATVTAEQVAAGSAIPADGYVLTYEYLTPLPPADAAEQPAPPSAVVSIVKAWAEELGLPLKVKLETRYDSPRPEMDAGVARYALLDLQGQGSFRPEGFKSEYYELTLCGITPEEQAALTTRLEVLPGLSPPKQREYSRQYDYLGSEWRKLLDTTVTINGVELQYPEDFTEPEAHKLRWQLASLEPGDVEVRAFQNRNEAEATDRLSHLGDVYKVERTERGLVLATLKDVWNEGRVNFAGMFPGDSNPWQANRIEIPYDAPAKPADLIGALAAYKSGNNYVTEQNQYPIHTSLVYKLVDPARLTAGADVKPDAKEVAALQAQVDAVEAAVGQFRVQHAECWSQDTLRWLASTYAQTFGALPVELHVYVTDATGETAQALRELLAQSVPGLPEPQIDARNTVDEMRKHQLETADLSKQGSYEDQMPPLPPPNPMNWCAYQGYRINFAVHGWSEGPSDRISTSPQLDAAFAAVAAWATHQGLTLNPKPSAPRGREALAQPSTSIGVYVTEKGLGSYGGRFLKQHCTLYVSAPDDSLARSLCAVLEPLPGVASPQITPCTFYFDVIHPDSPLEGRDLVVDGKRYSFPADFCWEEAISMSHMAPLEGAVDYRAFATLTTPKRDRMKFSDVMRVENAADGSINITTVKNNWPEGRELYKPPGAIYGGKTIQVQAGDTLTETEILERLAQELQQGTRFYQHRKVGDYYYSLTYTLASPQVWIGLAKLPEAPAGEAPDPPVLMQMQSVLTAWLDSHPECAAKDGQDAQVNWYASKVGPVALALIVSAYGNDDTVIKELQALLSTVPGAPEPELSESVNWHLNE